jgi:hypothetical protein
MSDAFRAPKHDPTSRVWRRLLAGLLFAGSAFCVALILIGLALDIALGISVTGVVCRTSFLGLVAMALFLGGRAVLNPARWGYDALHRDELVKLYNELGLAQRPDGDSGQYASSSPSELLSVARTIERDRVPQRYLQLMCAIKRTVEDKPR